jgi:beta-glucanase (GH16 family)
MRTHGTAARTLLLLSLTAGLAGFGRCGGGGESWRLTWADEFDGPAGQPPDAARWTFDVGTGVNGWGNGQLEFDTARPENASLDGAGNLVITARREAYQGRQYTSARMLTQGLFAQRYGRFEARIKLPRGQGIWPAFWMMGESFGAVGWPACGEIDVMEYRGQEPGRVSGSLHGPGYSGGQALTGSTGLPGGAGFDDAFHVFAVEWTPEWVAWELDGVTWQVVVRGAAPPGAWAFDQPFFILLNVAVGGGYVGDPDPSAFPPEGVRTLVDWVRVYQRAD